jgi:hypothetical protein
MKMMKIISVRAISMLVGLVVLVITGCMLVSCLTPGQPVPPYSYSGDKPIYPAVYHAIINGNAAHWRNAEIEVSDDGNEINIQHVTVADGLRLADFSLKISLVNTVVQYQFSDIMVKMPGTPDAPWPVNNFSQAGVVPLFTNHFNTEIPKIMEDDTQYATAKEESDAALGRGIKMALQNPNNLLIYPAVGKAFNSAVLGGSAYFSDVDCLDNRFKIIRCSAFYDKGEGSFINYDITISLQDAFLVFEFGNIRTDVVSLMTKNSNPPRYDPKGIAEQFAKDINAVLGNTSAYQNARIEVLGNNDFLSPALGDITSILENEFVETILKGVTVTIDTTISNVKENQNQEEYPSYAYEVQGQLYVTTRDRGAYASLRLYTNNRDYTRLKSLEKAKLSGTFVALKSNIGSKSLIMTDK